ncbi:MAG: D-glycero-beta-D-manno-heptose 1-phosphate adenylyltransferase [Armatimonadota bacterium]|nr:D-glycero-beta-D-manno-heptose 1-phosphate adenylyltransferase [Armatimonadota bacterium]MDW8290163.1 D-glycero-beta-D-manno-heptose 1-phosphate adenylyltransferase [Armatimonadota bacterium]
MRRALDKLKERRELAEIVRRRRGEGERCVFTNGCFDILHIGHVRYLQEARELGDYLVVAINSDESVRQLKGFPRPFVAQEERAEMLGALESVDYVTIYDELTAEEVIRLLRPEIYVKGGDYKPDAIVEAPAVRSYGGQVVTVTFVQGRSTTRLVERVMQALAEREEKSDG